MVDFYNFCRIISAKIDIFSRISRISQISRPRIVANTANTANNDIRSDIREYHRYSPRYSRPRIPHFRGDFANSVIFATPLHGMPLFLGRHTIKFEKKNPKNEKKNVLKNFIFQKKIMVCHFLWYAVMVCRYGMPLNL